MTHDLDPLPPLPTDVTSLLDEERVSPGLGAAARGRLRDKLASLGPLPLAIGEGLGHGHGHGHEGGAAAGGAIVGAAASVKGAIAGKLGVIALALGVGAVSGAAVQATLAPLPQSAPRAASPTSTVSPAGSTNVGGGAAPAHSSAAIDAIDAGTGVVPDDAGPAAVEPPASSPSGVASSKAAHEDRLKRERASLEVARTALTRRDFGAAVSALDRHAREFPRGQLAEERESMRVQALVGQGRYAEARERAARFHRDFPGSMLRGAVDAAVASIP